MLKIERGERDPRITGALEVKQWLILAYNRNTQSPVFKHFTQCFSTLDLHFMPFIFCPVGLQMNNLI